MNFRVELDFHGENTIVDTTANWTGDAFKALKSVESEFAHFIETSA